MYIKKEGPKPKDSGSSVELHAKNLTTSYTPNEGKFCAGLTTDADIGGGTSTPLD